MATAAPGFAWKSLAGRTAQDINNENALEVRQKRQAIDAANPGNIRTVLPDPQWDAFFGGLDRAKDTAAAQGMGFKANFNGMGQDDAMPGMAPSYYSPQGTAYYNGLNKQLSDDTAQFKLNQSAVLMADAQRRSQADAMMQDYVNRDAVSRAMQPGLTRDQSLAAAGPMAGPIGQMFTQQDQQQAAQKAALAAEAAKTNLTNAQADAARQAAAGPLTDAAIGEAANAYLKTGVMPTLGMGDKTSRQKIMNRAAELTNGSADIAANKANYKADSGSLVPLQKQRDAIGAFENTAGKNIDLYLAQAGKIVDSGSPMMNVLARQVSGKMLGSPDQAAFDAARQVAVNEIAKITSNPNLSGTLSDSARHEVENFNPAGATLAQTVAVMRLLKQDMGNRTSALDQQIQAVKGRISAPVSGQAAAPAGDTAARAAALIAKYGGK